MSPGYTSAHSVIQVGLKLKSVILFSFPSAGINRCKPQFTTWKVPVFITFHVGEEDSKFQLGQLSAIFFYMLRGLEYTRVWDFKNSQEFGNF